MRGVLSIDPGVTGCAIYVQTNQYMSQSDWSVEVFDTPIERVKMSTKTKLGNDKFRSEYLIGTMWDILRKLDPETKVVIEHMHSRPTDGAIQAFSLGKGFGIWLGLITAAGFDPILIQPNTWKKHYRLTQDKDLSLQKAWDLWPQSRDKLKRKKDHNRGEALIMADYAINVLGFNPYSERYLCCRGTCDETTTEGHYRETPL